MQDGSIPAEVVGAGAGAGAGTGFLGTWWGSAVAFTMATSPLQLIRTMSCVVEGQLAHARGRAKSLPAAKCLVRVG